MDPNLQLHRQIGVTWAKVKHLSRTKLNAMAGVLDGENADHWTRWVASNHGRAETKKVGAGASRRVGCVEARGVHAPAGQNQGPLKA